MLVVYILLFVVICVLAKAFHDDAPTANLRDEGVPLYVTLAIAFNGPHDDIVRTLDELGGLLQEEVDRCAGILDTLHAGTGRRLEMEEFRSTIRQNCKRLSKAFERAEQDFAVAGSPAGGPRKVQQAYAGLLSALVRAEVSIATVPAPLEQAHTELAFHNFLMSVYSQLSAWPQTIRAAIPALHGDSCALTLSVNVETASLLRALSQPA
ncbi:MAG TPA: hypothetical protein VGN11_12205 [Candidatus Baltobacteraceae bacterium]|jgi:hypothetical protein|nr:hypothetical protein [Candidatus Baltobacteraceae bacterium]